LAGINGSGFIREILKDDFKFSRMVNENTEDWNEHGRIDNVPGDGKAGKN